MNVLSDATFARNLNTAELADAYDAADVALSRAARLADALGDRAGADKLIDVLTALRQALPADLNLLAAEARDAMLAVVPF